MKEFQDAAAGVAFGDLPIDEDGAVRRMYLQLKSPEFQGLSFPVAMAEYFSDRQLQPGGSSYLLLGEEKIPLVTKEPDSALIDFHTSFPAQIVKVQDLLATGFSPAIFSDKIVLVGQSSTFGKDAYNTPAFRFAIHTQNRALLSGTEIHAAAITTLLSGRTMRILSPTSLWGLNFVLVLWIVTLVMRVRPLLAVAIVLLAILSAGGLALIFFQ
ncbi:MAG: CHASE2 domain-containing protein, partial [Candidatus Acidiferrales bacterium]